MPLLRGSSQFTVALLLCLAAPVPAYSRSSPSIPLKHCDEPKIPLGYLRAEGVVTYSVLPSGRPDTANFAVLGVRGMSAPGFRSAAVRLLAGCTFRIDHKSDATLTVFERLTFDSIQIKYAFADSMVSPVPGGLSLAAPAVPSQPVEEGDSALDEHPRVLECRVPWSTIEAPPSETRREMIREGTGVTKLRFVIGPDGRVTANSVNVLLSTNPSATQHMIQATGECRFAPGRIGGTAVATIVTRVVGGRTSVQGGVGERTLMVR